MSKYQHKEKLLVTAGGRILCHRCQAKSKRSGLQCRAPAMAGKVMCKSHGGASTGPRTEAGRRRIAAANMRHGWYSKKAIAQKQEASARLAFLEDALHQLAMSEAPKTRGRKPTGYQPLRNPEDLPLLLGIGCNQTDEN